MLLPFRLNFQSPEVMRNGGSKQEIKGRQDSRSHVPGCAKLWQILFNFHPKLKGYGHHFSIKGTFQSSLLAGGHGTSFRIKTVYLQGHPRTKGRHYTSHLERGFGVSMDVLLRMDLIDNPSLHFFARHRTHILTVPLRSKKAEVLGFQLPSLAY